MNWIKNNQKIVFFSFLLILVVITLLSLLPPRSTVDLGNKDKLSHLVAYSVLATNALLIGVFRSNTLLLIHCLVVYGGLMEFFQGFVPGREVSIWDMAANSSGVLIGFALIQIIEYASIKKK
jgi:VanZ family protein